MTDLTPIEPAPLLPMDLAQAQEAMARYQELTGRLLDANDWQGPPGRDGSFVKRRGWSKLATFYGVTTELVGGDVRLERDDEGNLLRARATVRAIHPNGRHEEASGACSILERRFASEKARQQIVDGRINVEHDLPATAETRARNRAIANLIGFGAVSAEEMGDDVELGPTPYEDGQPAEATVVTLPIWAEPIEDERIRQVAHELTDIFAAAELAKPAEQAMAIGRAIFDACDDTIPVFAADLVERLHTALVKAPPTQADADEAK